MRRTCRILVALDGTAASESALSEVERISAGGASVHFLQVVPMLPLSVDPTSAAVMAGHDRALAYLSQLRERLPEVRGIDVIRTGEPAEAILQVAQEFNIDLVAMGTPVRASVATWFLGSVAESVVRQTQLPVLLKRSVESSTHPLLRRILIPLDESEESHSILPAALDMALRTRAEVVILHVSAAGGPRASVDPKEMLLNLAARLEKTDVAFWQTIAEGDAVEEILAHADTLEADLIAMTGPAGGAMTQTLVGRSAMTVLGRTDRAVLLQRPVARSMVPKNWRDQ
jgi:nucleotide-binding universal stress UspA family protein